MADVYEIAETVVRLDDAVGKAFTTYGDESREWLAALDTAEGYASLIHARALARHVLATRAVVEAGDEYARELEACKAIGNTHPGTMAHRRADDEAHEAGRRLMHAAAVRAMKEQTR